MVHLVITHGRSQEFETPATLERQWSEDLRWGLERVDAPFAAGIAIGFAFYGDKWRDDDADRERSTLQSPTDLQRRLAAELLANAKADRERFGWDTLAGLVGTLDDTLNVGQVALGWFVKDVDRYFTDATLRDAAIQRVIQAVEAGSGDAVLLAHSLGTVVAYDALRRHPDLPVRGLVTFGSPLGLETIRERLEATGGDLAFPPGLARWANIYEKRDLVAANIALALHYPAPDDRRVEDAQSKGRRPSVLKLVSAHDARVYLSSVALGKATHSIVESLDDGARATAAPEATPDPAPDASWSMPSFGFQEQENGGGRGGSPAFSAPESERSWGDSEATADGEPAPAASQPDPGVATDDGEGTRTVERATAASFPPLVEPGSTHELTFQVGKGATGHVTGGIAAMEVPADATTLDLTVVVQATRFAVVDDKGDPASAAMDIALDLENEDALASGTFRLRAENATSRVSSDIHLRFLHDNNPVGTISLLTMIAKGAPVSAAPARDDVEASSIVTHPRQPRGAELVIYVTRDTDDSASRSGRRQRETYEINAIFKSGAEPHPPIYRLGSFPIAGDAPKFTRDILHKFRMSAKLSKPERRSRINALGLELWNNLPQRFRDFYWKHVHDRDITILICSDEPYIPWELVKPQRPSGGRTAPMLGQAFSMARWEDERHPPASIAVTEFVVVAPQYPTDPLLAAQQEATDLVERFNARREEPGTREQVTGLFTGKGPQVLHFSGHGKFEDVVADSKIALSEGHLDVLDVNNATFSRMKPPPLVFLNACEVGNQGWSLTQIGGWAEAFCRAGSTGFVGPYWAVNDRVARKASLAFYRGLKSGMTVGEAIQEVRARFDEDEEDRYHPSWLAYSLHCHPNVTVTLGDAVPAGG